MQLRDLPGLVVDAGRHWWNDNTFRLGASLAFYTIFSLAPVLLITIAIAELVFEKGQAREQILAQVGETVGTRVGQAISQTIDQANATGSGPLATALSVVLLLVGATAVFAELQDALNTIWGVRAKSGNTLWLMLKARLWSFTAVLGTAFLLLVSLIISTAILAVAKFLTPSALPGSSYIWQALNFILSVGFITVLFAMIYKLLPDVHLSWKDVWVGAFVTALLFSLGKYLIALYLAHSSTISAYGAAGSLVVVLLWVFYSSQILLYGAEFTQVYANRYGQPLVAEDRAEAVTEEAREREQRAGRPVRQRQEEGASSGGR